MWAILSFSEGEARHVLAVLKGIELLKSQGKSEAALRQATEALLDKHLKVCFRFPVLH
jgi:hypothetical protein